MNSGRPPRGWRVWDEADDALIRSLRGALALLPVEVADDLEERMDRVEVVKGLVRSRLDDAARALDFPASVLTG